MASWLERMWPLLFAIGCSDGTTSFQQSPPPPPPPPGAPATVDVSPNAATVVVGSQQQLAATVRDAGGQTIPNASVTWSSSSQAVASVSTSGVVTANSVGAATITAQSGTASGTSQITTTNTQPSALRTMFSTYIGGAQEDMIRDVAMDQQGNVYIAGGSRSPNYPTTAGSFDPTLPGGGMDAFVTKISPSGQVIWSSFVGGPQYDRAYGVEIDPAGDVVIAGRGGAGLPGTAGVFQPTFAGGVLPNGAYGPQDGFICKIAGNGASLRWCSYFGVADPGIIRDVAVDQNGDIYVAGGTELGGFPAAWFTGAVQPTKKGGWDLVLAKIKGDGSRVLWATYLGGSGDEGASPSVRVDSQGNVIVVTHTTSPDMPLANAAQPAFGGVQDMYVAKISPDGRTLLYATYLGGNGDDATETHSLWIDNAGNAVIAADCSSSNLATTPNAFQRTYGGIADVMVAKLSPTGAMLALTYLGGNRNDNVEGIATDAQGNVYLAVTSGGPFPQTTPGPAGTNPDIIAVELSPDLSQLVFVRRFVGSAQDQARSTIVDPRGGFYVVGQTQSSDWPTTSPFQSGFGGDVDGVVIRLAP